ncbi:BTB/POZ protein [Xylariaceae sp. FL0804]|nr:BTB/POZ protein [Xylariaceae sp. FL0804]
MDGERDLEHGVQMQEDASRNISPADQNASGRVTLQVGERRFVTFAHTLTSESGYFAARLSRWKDTDADGSYFVDSDPELFEHILRYLRSGHFPIFFDSGTQTFDHSKYLALLQEARYYVIPRLEEWISQERYSDAVKIQRKAEIVDDLVAYSKTKASQISSANTRVTIRPSWSTRKVHLCPRGIHPADSPACRWT